MAIIVTEWAHIRATEPKEVTEFPTMLQAHEYMNSLLIEWRACQLHVDGNLSCDPCPNPYKLADKTATRMWDDKNPEWRSFKGRY